MVNMVPDYTHRSDYEAVSEELSTPVIEEPIFTALEESPSTFSDESPSPALEELSSPALEESPSTFSDESPSPALEELSSPALEESPSTFSDESPSPALEESPSTFSDESPSPALEELSSPALEDRPSPVGVVAFQYEPLGEPLVFSSVLKFAFDVMDLVSELSNFHVKLRLRRPTFHPRLKELMTADMRELFKRHQAVANQVHLFQMVLNLPYPNNRTQLEYMLQCVLPWYMSVPFTTELFVEFCFMITFWTMVIRETNHWSGAPQVALEMIIHLTRGVLNRGGFGVCERWPTEEDVGESAQG